MKVLFIVFFISLAFGHLAAITLSSASVIYIHDIILGILILLGIRGRWPQHIKPVLVFAGVGVISLLINSSRFTQPELFVSSLYLVRWLAYAMLYMLVATSRLKPEFFMRWLYGSGLGIVILGHLQYIFYSDLRNLYYAGWDPHYERLFSTLLDPNFSGLIFVLTFLLSFIVFSKKQKILFIICQVLVTSALLLTFSRGSYLAFAASLFIWAILMNQWRKAAAVFVIFLAVVILLPKTGEGQNLLRISSSFARVENWQEGWQLFMKSPILGNGFNTLRYLRMSAAQYIPSGEIIISRALSGLDNSILFILATTGIVGLLAYAWIAKSFFSVGKRLAESDRSLKAIYFSSFVAIIVHSFFTNSLFYPWVMIWIWILVGVAERRIKNPTDDS